MCRVTEQEQDILSRMKHMLSKMEVGKEYIQGKIDVYGTTDAQAFARLLNEGKIEFIKGQQIVRLTRP